MATASVMTKSAASVLVLSADSGVRARDDRHSRADAALLGRAGKDLVMAERILVFDMDGVLVDVSESYRETIQRTVEHFTGKRATRESIQDWKNRGGWNDDWALSTADGLTGKDATR